MLCPRCQVPVHEGQCPSCGIVWDPEYGSEAPSDTELLPDSDSPSEGGPIALEVLDSKPGRAGAQSSDWRRELRRRLEQRSGQSKEGAEPETESVQSEARDTPPGEVSPSESDPLAGGDVASRLFDYQLKRPLPSRTLPNPIRPKEDKVDAPRKSSRPASPPRPVSREGAGAKGRPRAPLPDSIPKPLQRRLNLDSKVSKGPAEAGAGEADLPPAQEQDPPMPPPTVEVSREILLSRFLAGIIDVTVPLALGMSFALVAAWRIGFDFFALGSLRMALLFSLGFYLFNSLFFLLLAGQTPGMYAAQLGLRDVERRADVPSVSIVLRVLLFLPSCMTVIGLLWSVFDSERRCLHDIWSGSIVVNREPESISPRGRWRL